LGRKRVSGKAGFEEFLEELAPNKLLDRMFDKKDERFLQFMKVEFPAQFNELISFKKAQLLGQAEKAGSLKKVFDEVGKYSPEVRATIFKPEELKRLQLAEKYLSNITYARHPVFGNASGTAFMSAAGQAFESPSASLKAWGRDVAIDKFINLAGKSGVDSKLVGTLGAIEKAAQTITSDITNSVKYFLSKSGPAVTYSAVKAFTPEKEEKRKDKQKEFKKQSKEVTDVVANPDLLVEASTKAFADISEHAPGIADAATQKAAQGAMFLYEKMPKNPGGEFNIFANKQWKPSDFEISKWMKYVKTVDDPMSALKDMRKGLLSYEQVDTLKSVYPEIYNETKNAFMEELSGLKEELPYQKKMQIGILFGLPVDYSLNPAFIQQMQLAHTQSMQQEQNNQAGGMTPARADKLNFADKAKSGTQRIMTRA